MNEEKFNGMGNIYDKYRPSYPREFIEYLLYDVKLGMSKNNVIADIGSGTGILTRQLIEEGYCVFAVEPNEDMRKVAEQSLMDYKNFNSINGTAENTKLKDNSIDFITVAQAFHWFNRQKFKKECKRILKTNSKVILVWNRRDEKSDLVQKNDEINKKYCKNFKGFSGGMRGAAEDEYNDFFNGDYETKEFRNDLIFNEQEFIGRNLSASYALKEEDEHYSDYIQELKELFKMFNKNNTLIMPNVTCCYVGRV